MTYCPEGFDTVTPQITVSDGGAAIDHYKRAFGAVEYVRTPIPDTYKIMHACIGIGHSPISLLDEHPET